ncbi:MAG: ankyrin repeat domain-containing protein [Pyrinomonadaceae bacterium]
MSIKPTPRTLLKISALALLLCLSACADVPEVPPTPEAAKRFLKLRGYDFNEESFFKAAADGDVMAVNGFISAGINVNAKDGNDDTALTASAWRGDANIVTALLRGGADINAKGRNNWTALLLALEEERDAAADVLLAQPNIDLTALTPKGTSVLMVAIWHEREGAVRTLLSRGANVNHQDNDGDTPVHGAALYGNVKILVMLLDAQANPNVKNKLGGTPLMWAASYGRDDAVRVLLARGADPKIKDVDGITAAVWAARNGRGSLELMLRAAERDRQ